MFAAAGWTALNLPSDAVATGTVTRYHGDTQETITLTLKAKGFSEMRTDVQGSAGLATTVVNDSQGATITSSSIQFIPSSAAISMQTIVFPFFTAVMNAANPSVSLQFAGTETANGQQAYRIEMIPQPSPDDPLSGFRCKATRMTVWVATATNLPAQIAYALIGVTNPGASQLRIHQYSDWRVVNGIAVPFHQEEFTDSVHLYSLQLQTVTLNAGLTDSDFALPMVQQ